MTIYYNERDNTFTLFFSGDVDYMICGFKTYNEALEYYNKQTKG